MFSFYFPQMKDGMRQKNAYVHFLFYFYHYRVMSSTDSPKLPISKQLYYFNQSEFLAIMYVQLAQSMRTALNIEI